MAIVLADRVKETTTTTGTGTLTLAGAATNFQSFSSALSNGDETYYVIVDDTNSAWETGVGTFTSSGTTLSRDTILASSNSGSAVNLSAGTKDVFISVPAAASGFVGLQTPLSNNGSVNSSATQTQRDCFNTSTTFNYGGFTIATSGVTVPRDGIYRCYVNCWFSATITRPNVSVAFGVNSTVESERSASDYIRNTSGHNEASTNLMAIYELSASDEVNLFFAQESLSGTVQLIGANSHFSIEKLD